ncbi:MAG: chitobiase/beta-hexosaminidase C-terminal domain-containing protein [Bacteroidaceae bacterium]|nr:chitobiase/beta-hexosaminidase C-terminal domain-containing protein [Bacteroidaceae bacterium]
MKQFTLKSLMLLLLLLIGGGSSAWGETKTGTIKFGTNNLKISSANVTGNDDLSNSWRVVTVGTTSFTQQPNYSQVGSSKQPATSITFTMTLPSDVKFTSFSAEFGGFSGTKGNISLTVDGIEVGSGNLNAANNVTVGGGLKTAATGKELKVSVTGIAKGVKCYNIKYIYEDSSTPQPGEVALPTLSLEEGTYWKTQTLTIGVPEGAADVLYTLDGTDPKESNTAELITKATNLELSATTTVRAIAVDNNDNYSKEVSRTYTFVPSIANTKETAYTTAQAIEIIKKTSEAQLKDEVVYVKGVVSKIVTPFDSYYGNVSFDVSVDGSTEGEQFRFYRTQKDAENKYTEDPNIEVGATVIGCGTLDKYNDIYEFKAGNYLVDYKAPVEKVLKSIAISGEATKTTYTEGEVFDPTGLVVTATYEDESTEVVTSRVEWTFNPETLTLGTNEVKATATYGEMTASKTVTVTVAEVQKYNVTWNVNGNDYTEGNPTTEVVEGEKVEVLPAAPASIVGLVFMGWTNEAVTSQEAAPAVLFTSAADAPAVTADVTYYAVFAAQAGAGWTRVTALSDITEGSYVIKNDVFILPSSNTGSGEAPGKVLAPSITGNVITGEVDESMVWQFVSTGTSNQFYVKNAAGDYLYANKSNDGVRVHRTSDKWTFEENGEGYFSMKDENNNRYCATYEDGEDWRSYSSKDHGNYANGGKLELYRNDISYSNYTTTVETNSLILRAFDGKNYFATFSSDRAVKFVDATVYAVGVNDDRLILTEVESKQVPANTGVLLKSASTEATYSVIGSAPAIENNLLCASVEEGQTTAADGTTEGYSFFKLSYNQAGENEKLGFYWAKENGAPFVSKAGLAYLAVKTADVAAVKGFSLFDMETGISKVSGSAAGNGVIYDLQGRRVERAVRGLYIVNGRKVMVK